MTYPARVQQIVNALCTKYPDLVVGDDDARRLLIRKIAEQIAFELGPAWGTKASSPTNPPSKDAIALQENGALYAWDLINGASRQPNQFPESMTITGQYFIAVTPTDHLGVQSAPSTPETPAPITCQFDLTAVFARLDTLDSRLADLYAQSERIFANLTAQHQAIQAGLAAFTIPEFSGSVLGLPITLKPKK